MRMRSYESRKDLVATLHYRREIHVAESLVPRPVSHQAEQAKHAPEKEIPYRGELGEAGIALIQEVRLDVRKVC
jgi:hypothetical protein